MVSSGLIEDKNPKDLAKFLRNSQGIHKSKFYFKKNAMVKIGGMGWVKHRKLWISYDMDTIYHGRNLMTLN